MRHSRPRPLPHPLRELRRVLRRPPWYWIGCAALIIVITAVTSHYISIAEEGARRYGEPTTVVVATRALDPGARLSRDAVALRRIPRSALPEGALHAVPSAQSLRFAVASGSILTEVHLSGSGRSAVALRVGPRRRGVAIERGRERLPVRRGDTVELIAPDGDGVPRVLGGTAAVVAVDATTVTVSVDEDAAAAVAAASLDGVVSMVLVGSR